MHPPRGPLGSLSGLPQPSLDTLTVALVIRADGMCVACIMGGTALTLDAVLDAFRALEARDTLFRTWGRCPACREKNRAVFRLE